MGHVVSAAGIIVDPEKVKAVQDWPIPYSLRALRGFLGLTGYYRRFIRGYSIITAPLTALTKKNNFQWSATTQQAFENLKIVLTSPPIMALPNFSILFVIESDASAIRIGGNPHAESPPDYLHQP